MKWLEIGSGKGRLLKNSREWILDCMFEIISPVKGETLFDCVFRILISVTSPRDYTSAFSNPLAFGGA